MSNIAKIKNNTIENGLGVRTSVFLSGCPHHCEGCFQPETWNPEYGSPVTESVYSRIRVLLSRPWITGVTILGGEPLVDYNIHATREIADIAHKEGKDVWVYTGYLYEDLDDISFIDVLVDGRFCQDLKDPSLKFRGSSNQRIIDVKESIKQNTVIEYRVD